MKVLHTYLQNEGQKKKEGESWRQGWHSFKLWHLFTSGTKEPREKKERIFTAPADLVLKFQMFPNQMFTFISSPPIPSVSGTNSSGWVWSFSPLLVLFLGAGAFFFSLGPLVPEMKAGRPAAPLHFPRALHCMERQCTGDVGKLPKEKGGRNGEGEGRKPTGEDGACKDLAGCRCRLKEGNRGGGTRAIGVSPAQRPHLSSISAFSKGRGSVAVTSERSGGNFAALLFGSGGAWGAIAQVGGQESHEKSVLLQ